MSEAEFQSEAAAEGSDAGADGFEAVDTSPGEANPDPGAGVYDLSGVERHDTLPWDSQFEGRMVATMNSLGLSQDQAVGLISAFTADQGRTFDESTGATQWRTDHRTRLQFPAKPYRQSSESCGSPSVR